MGCVAEQLHIRTHFPLKAGIGFFDVLDNLITGTVKEMPVCRVELTTENQLGIVAIT